jgi:P4 family phage/plasmid primase-like protien
MVTVKAENIPDELKERDQWLLWDKSADTPRRPHWRGNFVSWNEPEDWHSFEEAIQAARDRESWGVGYVVAAGNDDYPRGLYGALDLDGCVDGNGPAEWLPSLSPFIDHDAYAEYSPSKNGLRIPVAGFELPDWWKHLQAGGDHQGIEAEVSKFQTFTGDKIDGAGESVVDTGEWLTEWLKEATEELTGNRPWEDQNSELTDHKSDGKQTEAPAGTGNAREIAKAVDRLDARDVAEKTIVDEWNDAAGTSGDNRAFVPTWAGSDCNGTANIVDRDGWTDTGGPGCGGPLQMAAIDAGDLNNSQSEWGNLEGSDWWDAVDHLRNLGFRLPEYEGGGTPHPDERDDATDATDATQTDSAQTTDNGWWDRARAMYDAAADGNATKGEARSAAHTALEKETDWMFVRQSETLWRYDETAGTFDESGEHLLYSRLVDKLGDHYSTTEKTEIADRVKQSNQVDRSDLNARHYDDPLLCVGNGVVNLRTGELLDHSPEYRFVRGLPHELPTEENGLEADESSILAFLDDLTERKADRDTLLDHLAHGLMPGHPYRAFVVTYGPGGNGKTQLAELFRGFVGRENSAAVEISDLATDDFSTSDLLGAYLNWGDDMSGDGGGSLTELSTLKKASGGSTIRYNEKHQKTFDFKNEAALFFSANEPPRFGEEKDSIKDRLYPVHMPYKFMDDEEYDPENPLHKKKVPAFAEKLLSDAQAMRGLLSLAVKHAQELQGSRGQYSMPEGPQERWEKYNQAADPLSRFASAMMEPGGADKKIGKDDAYTVYQKVVDTWDERITNQQSFKQILPKKVSADVETGESRALTEGESKTYVWKRVRWTEEAKRWMPDHLKQRYASHFETEEADDTDGNPQGSGDTSTVPVSELEPGWHDITVTVAEKLEAQPWNEGRGTLVDVDGELISYVEEGESQLSDVSEGSRVRIEKAKIGTDRDGLDQVSVRKVSTVAVLDDDQTGLDETDAHSGGATAADGGTETAEESEEYGVEHGDEGLRADADRLVHAVETQWEGDPQRGEVKTHMAGQYDTREDAAAWDGVIEYAMKQGRLTSPGGGRLRTV